MNRIKPIGKYCLSIVLAFALSGCGDSSASRDDMGVPCAGWFHPPESYPVGTHPVFMTTGDLDGDSWPDLIVSNPGSGDLSVLLQDRDHPGRFKSQQLTPVRMNQLLGPGGAAVADFDGDHNLDLVVPGGIDATWVSVLYGLGNGKFKTPPTVIEQWSRKAWNAAGAYGPAGVVTADFNLDGLPDFATALKEDDAIAVFYQSADRSFPVGHVYNKIGPTLNGVDVMDLTTDDFNHDGKPDLAFASPDQGIVESLKNDGMGGIAPFPMPNDQSVGVFPARIITADVNGDGNGDLAVANQGSPNKGVEVLLGNGNGTFQPPMDYAVKGVAYTIAAGRFHGGPIDLAVANHATNEIWIFEGRGDGTFKPDPALIIPVCASPTVVTTGDFNRDGQDDIAVPCDAENRVTVILSGCKL